MKLYVLKKLSELYIFLKSLQSRSQNTKESGNGLTDVVTSRPLRRAACCSVVFSSPLPSPNPVAVSRTSRPFAVPFHFPIACHGRRHDTLRAVGEHITWLYVFVSERRIFVLWARGHWREAYRPIACKENGIFWLMRKYNSERTTGPRSVPPNLSVIHARSRPGDRRRPRVVTKT